jgi:hypothetical protein
MIAGLAPHAAAFIFVIEQYCSPCTITTRSARP